jgi:hypothetical protein
LVGDHALRAEPALALERLAVQRLVGESLEVRALGFPRLGGRDPREQRALPDAVPEIDREKRTASFTFFIDPGRRVYIRKINISGNARTRSTHRR